MNNVIFDMETGDPDDIITLLMLLANPNVNLIAVTCYQGSPLQIGLIQYVLSNAGRDIPVAGWNTLEPSEISSYYTKLIGSWESKKSKLTPVDLFLEYLTPDTTILTGAPLTNLGVLLTKHPNFKISKVVAQGGYLGNVVSKENQLDKFKNRKEIQTYNLSLDPQAFDIVNNSSSIAELNFVTKDLCHGFIYTKDIHNSINFKDDANSSILEKALGHYAENNKRKAMHDPLAMLYMLYPEIGHKKPISMSYRKEDDKVLFSSVEDFNITNKYGLVEYDKEQAWEKFIHICSNQFENKIKNQFR